MCGVEWPHPGSRGQLPKRCAECHRSYWNDWQREKKRLTDRRPCRIAKCGDCGRFIKIVASPGRLPERCSGCQNQRELERRAAWRESNRDRIRTNRLRFEARHPDRIRANGSKQTAARKAAPTFRVTPKEIRRLLAGPCAYCGDQAEHIDHVTPLARGGRHSIGNLVGACAACNLSKSKKLLVEWRYGPSARRQRMLYRATKQCSVYVEALGRDVHLEPAVPLDDADADDAEVIKAWLGRGLVRQDNIEAATAAPGEQRSTRRKSAA